jgi:hypothetical protein
MIRLMKIVSLLALLVLAAMAIPSASPAQVAVGVSIRIGPPALPVYAQPICPAPGYIWTPGYWAYGPDGYYWVPGTWVLAPQPGFLWTPGYWGWGGGVYLWHAGYWGPHVGFYGGINYGFGYGGVGFVGGEWRSGVFHYNTAVTNVNTTVIHNTYINRTVINNNVTVNRVSYNGGTGGMNARPTEAERAAEHEHHFAATSVQTQHEHAASTNRAFLASENHGRPAIAASQRPGEFHGAGVSPARSASVNANRPPSGNNMSNRSMERNDRPPNGANNSHNNANHPSNENMEHPNSSRPPQSHANESRPPQNTNHPAEGHPNNSRPPQHESKPEHPGGEQHPSHGR